MNKTNTLPPNYEIEHDHALEAPQASLWPNLQPSQE